MTSPASSVPRTPSRGLTAVALASLVGMAMLWGSTFFMTKGLSDRMPVADLLAVRFAMMTVAMGLVGWRYWRMSRVTMLHGTVIGLIYGVAQLIQTTGLHMTTASSSGFITGLYVVFTPLLAARVLRERVPAPTWFAVVLATLGLGVLTIDPSHGLHLGVGEVLALVGSVLYACHIVAVDSWTTPETSMSLTLMQVATITVVTGIAAIPHGIVLPHGQHDWVVMVYLSLVAGAIPIFLQVWAQTVIESTTAAVLMAGEPVWAAVFAVVFGGEALTWQMVTGGGAMFVAMMIVTLLPRLRRRRG